MKKTAFQQSFCAHGHFRRFRADFVLEGPSHGHFRRFRIDFVLEHLSWRVNCLKLPFLA